MGTGLKYAIVQTCKTYIVIKFGKFLLNSMSFSEEARFIWKLLSLKQKNIVLSWFCQLHSSHRRYKCLNPPHLLMLLCQTQKMKHTERSLCFSSDASKSSLQNIVLVSSNFENLRYIWKCNIRNKEWQISDDRQILIFLILLHTHKKKEANATIEWF